ncbi:hypothetical protein GCM10010211_13290 [Streptomyces albospinus]|uniref:Uncharacterized protein n=1 Tax=Streptomyces albospinus TaxID=285515 RepID=A0ABQ2UU27_9ACTN|nr:hypothetical protein GCM10010211_13290 [Streptomyces albospinus]
MEGQGAQRGCRGAHPGRFDRTSGVARVMDQELDLDPDAARWSRFETYPVQVSLKFRFRRCRPYTHGFLLPSGAAAGLPPST